MISFPKVIDLPLQADEYGTIRVGGTRVTLESVVADHERGVTPEETVHDYPVLKLTDVYLVIAYYLENRAEVDAYIQSQEAEGERIRRDWEAEHKSGPTRQELMGRLNAGKQQRNES